MTFPCTSRHALTRFDICPISSFCCGVINWGFHFLPTLLMVCCSSFYCRIWQRVLLSIFRTKQFLHFFIRIYTKIMFDNETPFFGGKTYSNTKLLFLMQNHTDKTKCFKTFRMCSATS